MEYFLQVFGNVTVGGAVTVIGALVFLWAKKEKVVAYIENKVAKKLKAENTYRDLEKQVEQYKQLNDSIELIMKKLDALEQKWQDSEKKSEEEQMTNYRYRILRFDDEIRRDPKRTEEHYKQIMRDIGTYKLYCDTHPNFRNEQAVFAIKYIEKMYEECREKGGFLS